MTYDEELKESLENLIEAAQGLEQEIIDELPTLQRGFIKMLADGAIYIDREHWATTWKSGAAIHATKKSGSQEPEELESIKNFSDALEGFFLQCREMFTYFQQDKAYVIQAIAEKIKNPSLEEASQEVVGEFAGRVKIGEPRPSDGPDVIRFPSRTG